jgi:hypothetical protein
VGSWATVALDRTREDQVTGKVGTDGSVTVTVTQTWSATTDQTWRGDPVSAMTASDGTNTVPALGSYLEYDGTLFLVNSSQPTRIGPYTYAVQIQGLWQYTPSQSNTKWNVNVTFAGQDYQQNAVFDNDNNAIVNSANQPFDPALTVTYVDETISISYQTTLEQSASFNGVRGKVNSGSVTLNLPGISRSFDTRTVKCVDAEQSGSIPLNDGTATYTVTINLLVRTDGFTENVLDAGYYTTDDNDELVQIKDKNGDLLSAPALLDGDGDELAPGAQPVFLTFNIEQEADFTAFFGGLS